MAEVRTLTLKGRVPGGEAIEFLRAEAAVLPHGYHNPFVLVYYSLDGKKQPQGIRLDLDKQAFIDHFGPDSKKARVLDEAAPKIAELLYEAWYQDEGSDEEADR